ncbi:MAG TPA: c-type cytochrome [Geopsychrobacteraceae bacterium]
MNKPTRGTRLMLLRCLVALALAVLTAATTAAQEKHREQHDAHDAARAEHRRAMLALKDEIPEAYRIMERTPVVPDEDSLQQGRKQFLRNCSLCHGASGDGGGPAAAALKTPPANFLDKQHSAVYGPGEKFWIIGHGSGKTGMPAFPDIPLVDRWHLVNYILHLQQQAPETWQEHGHH